MNCIIKFINFSFIIYIVFSTIIVLQFTDDYYYISLYILFELLSYILFYITCIDEGDEYYNNTQQRVIITNNTDDNIQPQLIPIKVNNITELNDNFNDICPICIENIDPIDSFKLNVCNIHIFHEECINMYVNSNFAICPLCNV